MRREDEKQIRAREEAIRLTQEIGYLQEEMAATMLHFSDEVDPDMVDYYTYYYKAAEIKHTYLLKRLKKIYYHDKNAHFI